MTAEFAPALVLNADFRPLSILPLSTMAWQETVHNVVAGDFVVVEEYDIPIRSQRSVMRLPSVVAMTQFVEPRQHVPMTNYNLFVLRDRQSCAYCGQTFPQHMLTRDHVTPASRGGANGWENIVTACGNCNHLKRDRTPSEAGMPLLWRPYRPTAEQLARAKFFIDQRTYHLTWRPYLKFAA